jgi:exopolyphosphatase/guanosine-5'-triphosphate,3'-diphosphate pyrophosphatase
MSERVAAIDCGTNTIKLLIGSLPEVDVREMRMVRLGEGVDRTGELAPAALERAFAALDEYAALIREHGATRVRFVATSATRDARNADVFTAGVRDRLGIEPEVVTGEQEAALAYDGAVRPLVPAPAAPVLVVDIGGGSTELILGDARPADPTTSVSTDVGSVRLTERHIANDPPTEAEVAALVEDVDRHLDGVRVDVSSAATVVGVAGTITTVAGGVLGLGTDRGPTEPATISVQDVHAVVERLVAMSVAERLELPWMHPGRADVIAAGALILDRVLRRTSVPELVVSPTDILDGIAWSLMPNLDP